VAPSVLHAWARARILTGECDSFCSNGSLIATAASFRCFANGGAVDLPIALSTFEMAFLQRRIDGMNSFTGSSTVGLRAANSAPRGMPSGRQILAALTDSELHGPARILHANRG
jgi:hypothetical protein